MPDNRKLYLEMNINNVSNGLARFSYLVDPIKINKRINIIMKAIRKKCHLPNSSNIVLSKSKHDGNKQDNRIRFVISDGARADVDCDTFNNCSHIVYCEIAENGQKVDNENLSMRLITNDINLIVNVIKDVMLDIQMFYTLNWDYEFNTLEQRKEFSKLKVEFCKTNGMSSVLDDCVNYDNYCSFASFCRVGQNNDYDLDIEKYLQIWKDFSNYLISKYKCSDKNAIVNEIINNNHNGAMNVKKLNNKIKDLPSGRYTFIRIIHKIPSKHLAQVEPLFSGPIKIGNMIIVERIEEYKYIQFVQEKLLDIYKFII